MMKITSSLQRIISKKRVMISRIIFLGIALEYLLSHFNHFTEPDYLNVSYFLGTGLILLGAYIRCWAAGILCKVQRLVQEGPYALARNPLYIGSFLIACGFGFYLADAWYWIGMLAVFIFIYPSTIRHEEEVLKDHFPEDWKSYSRQVGMFWPIRINREKLGYPWSWQLWLKNYEHKTLILVILGLIAKLVKVMVF